jgi:hypothetical protein
MPEALRGFGDHLPTTKEKTMRSSIFEIQDNLHHFGARYVLWTEGLSIRTLYAIWIAQGMTQHQSNKWSKA